MKVLYGGSRDELNAKLNAVRLALHPEDSQEVVNDDGASITISHDPYYELEGALIDLERTGADKVCVDTVRRVQGRISAAMRILENKT